MSTVVPMPCTVLRRSATTSGRAEIVSLMSSRAAGSPITSSMFFMAVLKESRAASVFRISFSKRSSPPMNIRSMLIESFCTDSLAWASESRAPPSFGSSVVNISMGSREMAPTSTSFFSSRCRGGTMCPGTSWISESPRMVLEMRGTSSL